MKPTFPLYIFRGWRRSLAASAESPRAVFTRATAIGVVLGIAVGAVLLLQNPGLRGQPFGALRIAALGGCVYLALTLAAASALWIVNRIARAFGASRTAFLTPGFLWGAAALFAGYVLVNEARSWWPALEEQRRWLRGILLALFALLMFASLRRGRETAAVGPRQYERGIAALAIPMVALALLHFAAGRPVSREEAEPVDVYALAPRFEPAEPLTPAQGVSRTRILLVGIDGASWDRIDRGIAAGELPVFRRLVERGFRSPLASMVPTYSPAIWTTIITGVAPAEHGIRDFYIFQLPRLGVERFWIPRAFDPVEQTLDALGEMRRVPVTSSLRRRKALWNLADEAGLRSGVIGLWATWPPEPLEHGFVVSDHASLARRHEWLARRKSSELTAGITTYPPQLEERLQDLQRHPASVSRQELAQFLPVDDRLWDEFEQTRSFSKSEDLSAFRSSHLNDAFFLAAAERLWREDRPDLLVVYAKAVDELSHFFYEQSTPEAAELGYGEQEIARYQDVVGRAYAFTDHWLAPLVAEVDRDPGTLLLVVSDHGWEREPDGGYNHNFAPDGILIAYGAGVCARCTLPRKPSIFDVAPTVLARLGIPLSSELPGEPLEAIFERPSQVTRIARYGGASTVARGVASGIDPELNEKLRALGYID